MKYERKLLIASSGQMGGIGGVQRSFQILTEHLVSRGWDVSLIAWGAPVELAYPLPESVKVYFVQRDFEQICEVIEECNPSLTLIVNSSQWGLLVVKALVKLGKRYVYSIRGSYDYCLEYLWSSKFSLDLVFDGAVRGHVLMPSYAASFSDDIKKRVWVIPSQIEPATGRAYPDYPNESGRFIVLYSGRFSFEKRIDILINAFARISGDFPQWDLWLVGNGPLVDEMKELVSSLNIEDRVWFGSAANTKEMYTIYPKAAIKALPSLAEGCPMALREAMAHGVAVIAYQDCSGANEVVTHNVDGVLVPSHDLVEDMTSGLVHLMSNPELRARLGQEAIKSVKQYTPQVINNRWEKLLEESLDEADGDADAQETKGALEAIDHLLHKPNDITAFSFYRDRHLFEEYKREYYAIFGSDLFDVKYYLRNDFELKKQNMDPVLHYITKGWIEGRNPSSAFDNNRYLERYMKDVDNMCPLVHFYLYGRLESARPIPVRDQEGNLVEPELSLHYSIADEMRRDGQLIAQGCSRK